MPRGLAFGFTFALMVTIGKLLFGTLWACANTIVSTAQEYEEQFRQLVRDLRVTVTEWGLPQVRSERAAASGKTRCRNSPTARSVNKTVNIIVADFGFRMKGFAKASVFVSKLIGRQRFNPVIFHHNCVIRRLVRRKR